MKYILLTAILFVVGLAGAEEDRERQLRLVRETDPLPPEEERTRLRVPEGFTVQLFASEPMINKPINLAFDDRGRLWVSSTVEYPYAAAKDRWADPQGSRVKDSRDAIKILEDTNGDGKADKVTDFADGLNIPTGVLPWHKPEHKGGCIAWSIPNIWYFADTDGDGKCDLREVLFGPLGYEKDTHGMCSSFRMGTDGWVYATHGFNNTSHLKAKDGSTLDLHSGNVFRFRPDGSHVEIFGWGQVNPFGLCWDRRGNLYSADCHSNPITQLIRGAYYPSFGKPHDGLGHAPNMCEHSHGSTGLCGITYIDGGIWGPEWDDHMLLGNCVTSKVNHDKITFTGTTPQAREKPDFITSEDPWFRPVDLQLGPDNALYVADFYNRIIGHYEVPLDHPGRDKERGRIWRVVKNRAASTPRSAPPAPRAFALSDLGDADPFIVRGAAAWLAEHPAKEAALPLLDALGKADARDLQLRHQLRIAIREQLKTAGAYAAASSAAVETLTEISFAVPTLEAAQYLFERWPADTGRLLGHLARNASPATLEAAISKSREQTKAATQSQIDAVNALHNGLLERGGKPTASLLAWATELAESLLAQSTEPGNAWINIATDHSESPWCVQERKGADGTMIKVLSSLNPSLKGPEKLTGILRSQTFAAPARLSFWLCGHQGIPPAEANKKNLVRLVDEQGAVLHQAHPPRNDTAQRIEWNLAAIQGKPVRLEIVDGDTGGKYAWLGVGRFEQDVLSTDRFDNAAARQKQLKTLATILRTTAPVGLRDKLAAFLPQPAALAKAKPQPEIDALIKQRIAAFASGPADIAKGEALFTTHCAACHQIKGQGGLIGPQLDGIGSRGPDRLIEDILDPNRNVDTHFRLHSLKLRDGSTATGFIRGEVGQTTLLVDAAGNEQRIAKGDIAEDAELAQSLMPPAFGQLIEPAAFNHLLGWLLTH
jgi:putative heme-binding domain-containing protein